MDLYEDSPLQNTPKTTNGSERGSRVVVRAASDPAMSGDLRSLQQLTAVENTCRGSGYFAPAQGDIQPAARRLLAVWMFQVHTRVRLP